MHLADRLPAYSLPEVFGRSVFPSSLRESSADARPLPSFRLLPSSPSLSELELEPEGSRSQYELLVKIGAGGTASVFVGRFTGAAGFSRLFAIKRAHAHLLDEPAAQQMLVTEARLASRIHHANVVAVHDVDLRNGEVLLIMEYVEGSSLSELIEAANTARRAIPHRIAVRIILDACAGLAAVHELADDDGEPIGFVHRDVSPQNILVGIDGTSRIADFGLAKLISAERASGALNGKLAYLAPEVIEDHTFSVQSDVFAMGVVLWEALANQRLFRGFSGAETVRRVGLIEAPPLSRVVPELGPCLDNMIAKALAKSPERRYATVRELAAALEGTSRRHDLIATSSEVSRYAQSIVGDSIERRRRMIRHFDAQASSDLLFQETVSIVPGTVLPLWPVVSSNDLTPVHTRGSSDGILEIEELDTNDFVDLLDDDDMSEPEAPKAAPIENRDDDTTRHLRAIGPPREKPKPPLKAAVDEQVATEKSVSLEIPVEHTAPIEPSAIGETAKIASTDDRPGAREGVDKEALARAATEDTVVSEKTRPAARGPTEPTLPSFARLARSTRRSEPARDRVTMPPAGGRSAAASSRSLRTALASLVAVELALVVAVAGGWIPRPGGEATIQASQALPVTTVRAESTVAMPTPVSSPSSSERAPAPSASATTRVASTPPVAPRPLPRHRAAPPKPDDMDEPIASRSPETPSDEAKPTNPNPLSRAKRRAPSKDSAADDDSGSDAETASSPAAKAPPNPYK